MAYDTEAGMGFSDEHGKLEAFALKHTNWCYNREFKRGRKPRTVKEIQAWEKKHPEPVFKK